MNIDHVFKTLNIAPINNGACTGIEWKETTGSSHFNHSPVDGMRLPEVIWATPKEYETVITTAEAAFLEWRKLTCPTTRRCG